MAQTAPPSPPATATPVRARFDRFELDEENASLTCDGKPVALPPTPFAVLCALVRQQGALVTKNGLLDDVWGHRFVTESVLKTVIGKVRTALHDDARQPRFIETVSRRGYRFIASTVPAGRTGWAQDVRRAAAPGDENFIARADELARLGAAWDGACAGKRSIVWLAGDPGIGKTTLIERFVASLGDVACVRGQCVEQYGAGEPYLPVLEALAELCRRDAAAVALLRVVAPAWLVQLPWLSTAEERDALRRELAGLGADRMLREMAEFVERYTERSPLLVVTEDLHWSDRSTIQLLDYCARRRGGARFMWVASFRLSEVIALEHPLNRLRQELLVHGLCEELVLDPFSESEVAQYVARRSPSAATDEAFVRALHERTDGLPLFVDQILSDVAENAQDGESALAATRIAALAVPERLAALIEHYIVRLSDEERAVLSAAAVCGTEFRVGTIAQVLEADRATVDHACEDLARKRLLITDPRAQRGGAAQPSYSFRHALFRQVLYERTSTGLRTQLHRKAGSALESERAAGVPVASVELAMQFERGGDAMTAAGHYTEAAEAALLNYSPRESLMLAERGLHLLEQAAATPERDILEVSLATIAGASAGHLLGESSPEAKSWLQRAYALLENVPGHPMRATLLHLLGVALFLRGEYADAVSVAERTQALSSVTADAVLLRAACMIEGEVRMLQGRPRVAREWFERGLAAVASNEAQTPRDSLAADPQVTLLGLLALQLLHLGYVETARQRIAQAQQRARESAQPVAQMIAIWCDALLEVRLDNSERVAVLAAQMKALVEKFAVGLGRTAFGWLSGWALARTGRPGEGFRLIRDAYEENVRLEMLTGGSEVVGYGAEALLLAGDLEAAGAQLAEAFRVARALGERIYLPELFVIEARIARAGGKPREAEAALRRALAEAREQEAPWLELAPLMELCAPRGASRGDRDALAALLDRMPEAKDTEAVSKARAILAKR